MNLNAFLAAWLAWIPRSEQARFLRDLRGVLDDECVQERRRLVTDREAYEAACKEVEADVMALHGWYEAEHNGTRIEGGDER